MGENSGENSVKDWALERAEIDVNINDPQEDHGDQEFLMMKRMISGHPLFELLIETHINCLKVGLGEIEDVVTTRSNTTTTNSLHEVNKYSNLNDIVGTTNITNPTSAELDEFMEAYCMALNKLKEAMEEPLKDTTSFITNMYAELKELSAAENAKK